MLETQTRNWNDCVYTNIFACMYTCIYLYWWSSRKCRNHAKSTMNNQKTAQEPTCEIIGRIFFSRNQLLWVEKLTIRASAHLVHHRWFLGHNLMMMMMMMMICCTSAPTWQIALDITCFLPSWYCDFCYDPYAFTGTAVATTATTANTSASRDQGHIYISDLPGTSLQFARCRWEPCCHPSDTWRWLIAHWCMAPCLETKVPSATCLTEWPASSRPSGHSRGRRSWSRNFYCANKTSNCESSA